MKYFTLFIVLILFISCKTKTDNYFTIYSRENYIPEIIINKFESTENITVINKIYYDREELESTILAGLNNIDLTIMDLDSFKKHESKQVFEPIVKENIPFLANINPKITTLLKENNVDYSSAVPYFFNVLGFTTNHNLPNFTGSLAYLLSGTKLKTFFDKNDFISLVLKHLGYSMNSVNPKELALAKDFIIKNKLISKKQSITNSNFIYTSPIYVLDSFKSDPYANDSYNFTLPMEGHAIYVDLFVISNKSKNKPLAYKFINNALEPFIQAHIMNLFRVPSFIKTSEKFSKELPLYSIEDMINKGEIINYSDEKRDLYNKIWQEIYTTI